MISNLFKKETPKEAAMKAKREARREVRVSEQFIYGMQQHSI
jgi:hypothetical protein